MSGVILGVKSQETLGSPVGKLLVPAQERVTELPSVVIVEGRGSFVNNMFGSGGCNSLYDLLRVTCCNCITRIRCKLWQGLVLKGGQRNVLPVLTILLP